MDVSYPSPIGPTPTSSPASISLFPMSSLLNSRWAPGAREHHAPPNAPSRLSRSQFRSQSAQRSSPTTATPSVLSPSEELARFMKIVSRLRWKLPFLAEGYRLATQSTTHEEVSHAEIMFKIDFHEYYALLERAIVHLLGVFNITVSSSFRGTQMNGNGRVGVHRYHANVLEALEQETSPLSPVLGSGHVLGQLQQAKELRNRWKTADMTQEERERDPVAAKRAVMPLASYDFETILTEIFGGLEEAYVRAREHVDKCRRPEESTDSPVLDSEADWEFMVDAMDWEAV